jgi:hypothetical protein
VVTNEDEVMSNQELTLAGVRAKAEALKALGCTVYLREDKPYALADGFEEGSSFRLSSAVSGYFTAKVDGVPVRWSFDLEKRNANGSGTLQPDTDRIRETLAALPAGIARNNFQDWLRQVGEAMNAEAAKSRAYADSLSEAGNAVAYLAMVQP